MESYRTINQSTKNTYSIIVCIILLLWVIPTIQAQEVVVKTNTLYWLTGTINAGGEMAIGERTSCQLSVQYNPWNLADNKKIKHCWLQPEVRYWFSDVFMGAFMGAQLNWGQYNIGKIGPFKTIKEHRYQGNLIGCGVTAGYQWMLSSVFNLEASASIGYLHLHYKKYGPEYGDYLLKESYSNYGGPYQIGLSLVYILK